MNDNSSLQTLLQVPIVQVLTNGESNPQLEQADEQIYLLSIKVDDGSDDVNGGTTDTKVITTNHEQVAQFNEPLRTSTPTMIENGMNETILSGNVEESDKKIAKEDNDTNCKMSDNAKNDEVWKKASQQGTKSSQEDIQNEDKKIDDNKTTDSEISNKQISENFHTEESIPKKKTNREIHVEKRKESVDEWHKEKSHNLTYCRNWVADNCTNVPHTHESSVQSDCSNKRSTSTITSDRSGLLDVTSVSRNVPKFQKGKEIQKPNQKELAHKRSLYKT